MRTVIRISAFGMLLVVALCALSAIPAFGARQFVAAGCPPVEVNAQVTHLPEAMGADVLVHGDLLVDYSVETGGADPSELEVDRIALKHSSSERKSVFPKWANVYQTHEPHLLVLRLKNACGSTDQRTVVVW